MELHFPRRGLLDSGIALVSATLHWIVGSAMLSYLVHWRGLSFSDRLF